MGSSSQPLVSIVIPAYKAAGRIRETLDSAFAQTYPNFEVILVNDGSPDTAELEAAIRGYDERLIYIKQENRGPSAARNAAVRQARGKYIACLDSDDIYFPDHLARQVELLEGEGLVLAYSDSQIVRNGLAAGHAFEHEPQHPPVTFEKLLKEECCVMTSATVASRQAMIEAGLFDERYRRCEDFDLWLRISFRGGRMGFYPRVGIEHRRFSDGLSADNYLLKEARVEVYKKILSTLALSPAQKDLVRELIAKTEGRAQMDLVKRHVREGHYAEAAEAAEKAAVLLQDGRTRRTAWMLRHAPWLFASYLRAREGYAAGKRKVRAVSANSGRARTESVQLQSKGLVGRDHPGAAG